jgi:ribose-phosphate pyrophosphokinase
MKKVLNLVYPEKSEINFTPQSFPDGQQNIVINPEDIYLEFVDEPILSVKINSKLNNWLDLELIVCAVASLKELGVKEIHLYVPYIIGARSDRKFQIGGNNYLKDVICPVLNSLGLNSITCMDPHSTCLEMGLKNFIPLSNKELVRFALTPPIYEPNTEDNFLLVAPDAGAGHKIYKLAEEIGYYNDIIICSKERDEKGKLSKFNVPLHPKYTGKDFIIIDDICDGGNTFINIAKVIKQVFPEQKIYLIVTHSIFSAGLSKLMEYFDNIYTTNSCGQLYTSGNFDTWLGVNKALIPNIAKGYIKQLNIF